MGNLLVTVLFLSAAATLPALAANRSVRPTPPKQVPMPLELQEKFLQKHPEIAKTRPDLAAVIEEKKAAQAKEEQYKKDHPEYQPNSVNPGGIGNVGGIGKVGPN